jgi:hypothetical protein
MIGKLYGLLKLVVGGMVDIVMDQLIVVKEFMALMVGLEHNLLVCGTIHLQHKDIYGVVKMFIPEIEHY